MSPPLATGRKRAKKPKTRTGCISCKSRRVKCDEGIPACMKCIKLGVRCEGYQPPHLPNMEDNGQGRQVLRALEQKSKIQLHVNPLIDPSAFTSPFRQDPAQNRYFLFFKEETISELSGSFEEGLFSTVDTATQHLQSASRLLCKQLAEKAKKYRHTSGKSPTSDIEESIIASYVRLDNGIFSCLKIKLEQTLPTNDVYGILKLSYAEDQAVPSAFVSIHEARNHLEALQFHSLPILTKEFHNRMQGTSSARLDEGKTEAYLTALRGYQAWNRAFTPLYNRAIVSPSGRGRNPELIGAAIMRARGMTTILAIQTLLPVLCEPVIASNNMRGNDLAQNCNEVLTLTRSICADPDFRRDFVLDCGILPGLFMVIVAPVEKRINREALELMRSLVPRREGVWASADLVTAGEAFMRGGQV